MILLTAKAKSQRLLCLVMQRQHRDSPTRTDELVFGDCNEIGTH